MSEPNTESIKNIAKMNIVNKKYRRQAMKIIESLDLTDDDLFVFKMLPISDKDLLDIAKEMLEKQEANDNIDDTPLPTIEKEI